ncbi:MAG: ABC transporter permease, partial [Cyclobacteriaceae bacterium]|nr:ABC transporter permease [Cyclobacteriaceae bacterium]
MNRDFLKLAWRNIWRNKRRSYITMSSVAFAVLLSCLMMSVQYGSMDHMVDNMVKFYTGHIQIHHDKYWDEKIINNSLSYDDDFLENVEHLPGVQSVVPRIESFALAAFGTKTKGSMVLGIDPKKEQSIINVEKKLKKGKYFNADDQSILVSTGLAKYLSVEVGDSLVLFSQGYHGVTAIGLYKICGLIRFPNPEQNNRTICMPLKEAQWFYGLESKLTSIAILVNSKDDVESAKNSISTLIDEKSMAAMDWGAMMPNLVQTVKLKHTSTEMMIMVLYLVIGFGMFGTFLMMTAERTREFGIMLAIGMHRRWLQFTVFVEIVMMSLIGVLAGIVMSLFAITYFYYNPPP